jgi:general secretion pathway protein N
MAGDAVMRRAAAIAMLLLGAIEARAANTPNTLDLPPSNVLPAPVDITPGVPAARPPDQQVLEPSGNPLWAIPLSTLTATRERPLFTPSRRAPAPAVAGPVMAAPPPPPPPTEAEHPPLTLIGAIAGESEGFAVFLAMANNNVIRHKTGQGHQGWVLRSVKGREATLQKDRRIETLVLPAPDQLGGIPGGEPASGPAPPRPPGQARQGRRLPSAVPLPGGGLGVPRNQKEPEL